MSFNVYWKQYVQYNYSACQITQHFIFLMLDPLIHLIKTACHLLRNLSLVLSLLLNAKKRYKAFPLILFNLHLLSVVLLSPYYDVHHQFLPGSYKGYIVTVSLRRTSELQNHMCVVVLDMKSMSNTQYCITLWGYSNIYFPKSMAIVL